MMMAWRAFVDGAGRVLRAPALLAGVFLLSVLMGAPAGGLRAGAGMPPWEPWLETATGLEWPFTLDAVGVPAVPDNVGRAVLAAFSLVAWLFLLGGLIDRLARNRPTRAPGFFGACGAYFLRFVRLAVVGTAGYLLLFGAARRWLPGRTGLDVLSLVFGVLLVTWTLMLDYAKVRAVVEDRRSMLGAMLAGSRFALRHPMKTGLLWALNAAALLGLMSLYGSLATTGLEPGGPAWPTFAAVQVYVVARLFLKLVGYASQVSLFQTMLAHSPYSVSPMPEWPDSPSSLEP